MSVSISPGATHGNLEERSAYHDAGVVDEDVESAKLPQHVGHQCAHLVLVGHVGSEGRRAPPPPLGRPDHLDRAIVAGPIVHRDIGALPGKSQGDLPSEPAAGSGDQGHAAGKPPHRIVHPQTPVPNPPALRTVTASPRCPAE